MRRLRTCEGSVLRIFLKGVWEALGRGAWDIFQIGAFTFMRRLRTREGSLFEDFPKEVWEALGGGPGKFSKLEPSILCAACVLERGLCLRIFQWREAATRGGSGERLRRQEAAARPGGGGR